jgi:hypothetical protein
MIPQTQSRTGEYGRCFPACIASLLDLKEWEVPDLDNTDYGQVDDFLGPYGYYYREIAPGVPPVGYHVIIGTSPRGGSHAVVGLDGELIFDPHPQDGTGKGLKKVTAYGILCKTI